MSHWENNGQSDEWYTPQYIFDALNCEFDLDVAAPEDRTHCCVPTKRFITKDSLQMEWNGFIWMNPPFGKRNSLSLWFDKINIHGNGIGLCPDRTSAPWWQKAADQANRIFFVNGKIRFIKPDGSIGSSPSNGTTLFGYGEKAIRILDACKPEFGISLKHLL